MSFENLTKAALNPTPQDLAQQARALAVEAWHKEYDADVR